MKKRNTFRKVAAWAGFLLMNGAIFGTALIVRNLGWLVGLFAESGAEAAFDFALIFEQTKDAQLSVPWFLSVLWGILFWILAFRCLAKVKNRPVSFLLMAALFLVLLGIALLSSLMLTRVNDIRFYDLLRKLLPLIGKL